MSETEKRKAEGLILFKNVLSGLFPVVTVVVYAHALSPLWAIALSSLTAAVFFIIVLTVRGEWKKNLKNTKALRDVMLATLFIAIGFHGLYFLALKFTSPQNTSLLSLMEIVFSFLVIGMITGKEPVSRRHFIGAALMMIGAGMVLFQDKLVLNLGDLLMLGAVLLAPIGNIFAKRALHQVSLSYVMFVRSIVAGLVFLAVALIVEGSLTVEMFTNSIWYLLFAGVVFFGVMKIITQFGFKKTTVTHTIALGATKPIFAFIFAWWLLKDVPTLWQTLALIPSFIGLYYLATAKLRVTTYKIDN